jgi:1-deoxyxylulose-5-phosphate synthase
LAVQTEGFNTTEKHLLLSSTAAILAVVTMLDSLGPHHELIYHEQLRKMNSLRPVQGVGSIPWSLLTRGFLTGSCTRKEWGATTRSRSDTFAYNLCYTEDDFAVVERIAELPEKHSVAPAQIALSWMLHKPGITAPIVDAGKMLHLERAVAALDNQLSAEDLVYLEELHEPHPALGRR